MQPLLLLSKNAFLTKITKVGSNFLKEPQKLCIAI